MATTHMLRPAMRFAGGDKGFIERYPYPRLFTHASGIADAELRKPCQRGDADFAVATRSAASLYDDLVMLPVLSLEPLDCR